MTAWAWITFVGFPAAYVVVGVIRDVRSGRFRR